EDPALATHIARFAGGGFPSKYFIHAKALTLRQIAPLLMMQTGFDSGTVMKSHARVVVIGGGVIGCSVLYHLTKLGWKDVVLCERKELTAGSSWHAAGGFHALNSDPGMSRLQAYTIRLYREIERLSGQDIGLHFTGGLNVAATRERW